MQQGSEDDAVPQSELVDARPRAAVRIRNPQGYVKRACMQTPVYVCMNPCYVG